MDTTSRCRPSTSLQLRTTLSPALTLASRVLASALTFSVCSSPATFTVIVMSLELTETTSASTEWYFLGCSAAALDRAQTVTAPAAIPNATYGIHRRIRGSLLPSILPLKV
jgi:hypothetical protein